MKVFKGERERERVNITALVDTAELKSSGAGAIGGWCAVREGCRHLQGLTCDHHTRNVSAPIIMTSFLSPGPPDFHDEI